MNSDIDYSFISDLEGGCFTEGYVPDAGGSKSGVTIATGFDLGARNENDLLSLGLPSPLVDKLKPCLGKKSSEAADFLASNPLTISEDEAKAIDEASHSTHTQRVAKLFDEATPDGVEFSKLPAEAQTVIASVSFQYGVNLPSRTPNFWKLITSQDWASAVAELNNFGDKYPTRRKKEAALLERIV